MAHTLITFMCECSGGCAPVCPAECIELETAADGARYSRIDSARCTDCGACSFVCPIQGAIITYPWASDQAVGSAGATGIETARRMEALLESGVGPPDRFFALQGRMQARMTFWASDCAARVLHLYEDDGPGDMRARMAILAAREFAHALWHVTRNPITRRNAGTDPAWTSMHAASENSRRLNNSLQVASASFRNRAAELAAKAAAFAGTANALSGKTAAAAIAAHLWDHPGRVAEAWAAELDWQYQRLRIRLSASDIGDWPLPPVRQRPVDLPR